MFQLIVAAAGGSVVGAWVMAEVIRRSLTNSRTMAVFNHELGVAFKTGFLTAAEILTMEGHEEIAGKLRHTAAAIKLTNNNN